MLSTQAVIPRGWYCITPLGDQDPTVLGAKHTYKT